MGLFISRMILVNPLTTHLSFSLSHDQIYSKYDKYWTEEDKNQVH